MVVEDDNDNVDDNEAAEDDTNVDVEEDVGDNGVSKLCNCCSFDCFISLIFLLLNDDCSLLLSTVFNK